MPLDLKALKLSEKDRPFVCDGNPLDCEVFIVGFNPATEMENKFEDFYKNGSFDRKAFKKIYKDERTKQRTAAGKDVNKVSKTRKGIETITSQLEESGIKVLETNLYFKPTAKAKELKKEDRKIGQFLSLLTQFKGTNNPKVVFVHGGKTLKDFVKALKIDGDFTVETEVIGKYRVEFEDQTFTLLWTYHLSFQKMATETMLNKVVKEIKVSIK